MRDRVGSCSRTMLLLQRNKVVRSHDVLAVAWSQAAKRSATLKVRMSDTPSFGNASWFRELLDRLDREAGPDWHRTLAQEVTETERVALIEALDRPVAGPQG